MPNVKMNAGSSSPSSKRGRKDYQGRLAGVITESYQGEAGSCLGY